MDNCKAFVLLVVFFLCGCHQDRHLNDLKLYIKLVKQKTAIPIEKLENLRIIQAIIKLSPHDPFQPTTMIQASRKEWAFQDLALCDLELVGTILQGKTTLGYFPIFKKY